MRNLSLKSHWLHWILILFQLDTVSRVWNGTLTWYGSIHKNLMSYENPEMARIQRHSGMVHVRRSQGGYSMTFCGNKICQFTRPE